MTENVASLRSAKAAIPCGLAVRKRFWQTVRRQQVWKSRIL